MKEQPKELTIAVNTLEEHKAENIQVIEVEDLNPFCSYYVLATAQNVRALKANFDYLEEAFFKNGIEMPVSDSEEESGWVILQGGDVIVQVFLPEMREKISLEKLIESIREKNQNKEKED